MIETTKEEKIAVQKGTFMMLEKVRKTIQKYHMLPQGAQIVIGLSGGADSVALCHILHVLAKQYGWQLLAVHVHHGLRGAEADADAAFVQDFAQKYDIPCQIRYMPVRQMAEQWGKGLEETGRIARYEIFSELAGAHGKIAVAHHANDQAETLLMRLCRGTGLQGMQGMLPTRANVVRPLLFCSRAEIETYCQNIGLSYRTDSTNQDTVYARNHMRHEVLPLLEKIYAGSTQHLAEAASRFAEENAYMQQEAEHAFAKVCITQSPLTLSCTDLIKLHSAIRRRVLRFAVQQAQGNLHDLYQSHIQAMEALLYKQSGKQVQITGGLCVKRIQDTLLLEQKANAANAESLLYAYPLAIGETVWAEAAGCRIRTWISPAQNIDFVKDDCTKAFDYDKITQTLYCRNRRAGDTITLSCGTKKIKKLWIDEKRPVNQRAEIPLIACGTEIVWIYGGQVSAEFAPTANTKTYLWIEIKKE